MTQAKIILKLLREAGSKGVHSFDLYTGAHTLRCGARIYELKKEGYEIISKPEKKGNTWGVRYFLIEEVRRKTTKKFYFHDDGTVELHEK